MRWLDRQDGGPKGPFRPMGMRFVPLGVGDAFSALHYSACVAVEAEGTRLLVDCPHPIRKILREGSLRSGLALDVGDFEATVLTHLHADHCSGVEGYGYYAHFVLGRKARVAAHPEVLARLWDGRLAGGMEELRDPFTWESTRKAMGDFYEVLALDGEGETRIGAFAITCRRTRHHVPTYALKLRAGGRTLGISADTAYDPDLLSWLCEADLVLHETGLGIHTPYETLAALPAAVRAKLRLTHFPDGLDASDGRVEPLVEGRLYDV